MSIVSPKTNKVREEVEDILTKLTVNLITMSEATHAIWRIMNDLTNSYDEGYNHGWKACEEELLLARFRKKEPPYEEL